MPRASAATPPEDDGEGKPQHADVRDARHEDEDLEGHGRRENGRHEHGKEAIAPECGQRAIDAWTTEALPDERFPSLAAKVEDDQAPSQRPKRGADDKKRHQRLLARHHQDDHDVRDFRKREKGRIDECDKEQAGHAERERGGSDPGGESPIE